MTQSPSPTATRWRDEAAPEGSRPDGAATGGVGADATQPSETARWRPRIVDTAAAVEPRAAERAAAALLSALGMDLNDPNLVETPRRMAGALIEMTSRSAFDLTTFPNDERYDELVLVEDIPVRSLCEHHMLPFVGVAHIGYLPGDRILGLSKFARMVEFHASRPQTQERLTQQIANHLQDALAPRGVGVVIRADHTCMTLRGARAQGSHTTTSALFGRLRDDPRSRSEFLDLTRRTS